MSAQGNVSSMPKRTPIRLVRHLRHRAPPRGARRGRILADRGEGAQSGAALDSAPMKREYGSWTERRALAPDGVPLVRRPRAPRPLLPDVDGALLPERGLRPHGRARRQGRRRLAPADLRRLRGRGELVQQEDPARATAPGATTTTTATCATRCSRTSSVADGGQRRRPSARSSAPTTPRTSRRRYPGVVTKAICFSGLYDV